VTATTVGRGGAGRDGFRHSPADDVSTAPADCGGRNTSFSKVNFTPGVIFLRTGSELAVELGISMCTVGDLSELLLLTCDDMLTGGPGL